jgi:hypothetical protein
MAECIDTTTINELIDMFKENQDINNQFSKQNITKIEQEFYKIMKQ